MNRSNLTLGLVIAAVFILLAAAAVFLLLPQEKERPFVYILYSSEKGDLSYTDSAYRGLFVAQETRPFSKREFSSAGSPVLLGLLNGTPVRERPGFIITISYLYTNQTEQMAAANPDIRFLAIDQSGIGSSNVRAYEITAYGSSYLSGVLAASATKTRRVGIILAAKGELLDAFRQGFVDGVHAVDPAMPVDLGYIREYTPGGYTDPGRAAGIAEGMYRNQADVIYTVAGFSGTGAISEAKKSPGRYIIGVDSDQTRLGPTVVLASAVKRVDRVVSTGIGEYLDGSFTGGEQVAGLKEGVTGIVYNPKFSSYNETVSAWEGKAEEAEEKYLASRTRQVRE